MRRSWLVSRLEARRRRVEAGVFIALVLACGGLALSAASAATGVPEFAAAFNPGVPTGPDVSTTTQAAALDDVTCTGPGDCVGVGYYEDGNGPDDYQAMVVDETNGTWAHPTELAALPSGAATAAGEQSAFLDGITCTSTGDCTAVGGYNDTTGSGQAMVVTETNGAWAPATKLALPSGADTVPDDQDAYLNSVTCTSPENCVAVGVYYDTNGAQDLQAMIATETSGMWASTKAVLPGDAATGSGEDHGYLETIICTGPGVCVAGGDYLESGTPGGYQAMLVTETSGTWTPTKLALPTDAVTITGDQDAGLQSIACTSAGNCVAVGYYEDATTPHDDSQAMAASETSGTWAQPTKIVLPPTATTAGNQDASLDSVTCAAPGSCVAVGEYYDNNGLEDSQAISAAQTGGVWTAATQLSLPSDALTSSGDQEASLRAVACTTPGTCVATGTYTNPAGYAPMIADSLPSLAVSTPSLPAAVVGTAYSAQLAASGGAGHYTWSVSAGTLPAGLTLNTASGLISGTPTAVGSEAITVLASDPGPPAQQASAALTIAVGGPNIGAVKVRAPKLKVAITCGAVAPQICSGTLALSVVEHLTAGKITAVLAKAKHHKKPKHTTRTVGIGKANFTVSGGSEATVTVTLNKTGKQLLTKYHKLHAKLADTPTGLSTALTTQTVTITPVKAKPKHKHHRK
jgi:hypothetical protein